MPTPLQIALLVCGLLGAALKAYVTQSQATFSRRSIADILTGGAAAVLVPIYLPALLPAAQNVFAHGLVMFLLAYASSDFVTNILVKMGAPSVQRAIDPGSLPK